MSPNTNPEDTRSYYGSFSKNYDSFYSKIQYQKYSTLPEFDDNKTGWKLDLGGGTGLLAEFSGDFYINLDLALPMLRKDITSQRSLVCIAGDMKALPLRSASISVIVSFTAIQNSDNIPLVFNEMTRVSQNQFEWYITALSKSKFIESIKEQFKPLNPIIEGIAPEDVSFHISSELSGSKSS